MLKTPLLIKDLAFPESGQKQKRRTPLIAQNGRTSSISHKELARGMQITETSSGPTVTKETRHLTESDRRDLPFTRFSEWEV